jgi:cytochrome P450
LDAVLREALRLRPILPNVARQISQPIQLGGYHVPAGTFVAPCIYLTHRHKDLYPDPEQFLPERWLGKKPDPYQWLPFGGGARRCIGLAFALLEMKVVMAVLLGRKDLALASDVQMPTKRRGITLSPQGVRLKLGVPPRE